MPQISYEDYEQSRNNQGENQKRVGFFSLKNDKDEAVVRIMHDSPADFDIVYVHSAQINGRFRKVNCIRDPREPISTCPFCEAKQPLNKRIYIHLLEYSKDNEGNIVVTPKIWERSSAYITTLKNLCDEYAPLSDSIFKIKRNGVAGSIDTTYDILYANPTVYRNDLYVKDTTLLEGVKALGSSVIDADYAKLQELLESEAAPASTTNSDTTTTPVASSIPQATPVRTYTPDYSQQTVRENTVYNNMSSADINAVDTFSRPKRLYQ